MSEDAYFKEAKQNYEASQVAYSALKNRSRMATSPIGSSGSSAPQSPRKSDEVVISPEDFSKEALANFISSKVAYKDQLDKTRKATELARPPTGNVRASTSSDSARSTDSLAKEARDNFLSSKKAYRAMMDKTRRPTQFAGETITEAPPQLISPDVFAAEAKSNYLASKQAYKDMKDRQ